MTPPRTGRPREFDIDVALEQVMEAFWERGYEATTVADLMEATGLQKGSLYKAFGDKHSLYVASLKLYLEQTAQSSRACLRTEGSPREALEQWFEFATGGCSRDGGRGCFGVNALVELGNLDEEVTRLVDGQFRLLGKLFAEVIARGQSLGEFRTDTPAQELADFLGVFLSGLNAKARGPLPRSRAKRLIASALAALDA